ncbi:MAG: hypothetical protein ACHQ1D_01635 [Nitrososphaerales archaeon]
MRVTREQLESRVEALNKRYGLKEGAKFVLNGRYGRTYLEVEDSKYCPIGNFCYCGTKQEVNAYIGVLFDGLTVLKSYSRFTLKDGQEQL